VSYRWLDHTAEVELVIEAVSDEAAFGDAMQAYAELVAPDAHGDPARYELDLAGADRGSLLAAWVDELVFLAETEAFVPHRIERFDLGPAGLHAVIAGCLDAPVPLVKAVTYHRLEFVRDRTKVRARLVLDV
jgi:SHS2 domain-containing protein